MVKFGISAGKVLRIFAKVFILNVFHNYYLGKFWEFTFFTLALHQQISSLIAITVHTVLSL